MTRAMTILILCTGNSARSILAEALFGRMGNGRVIAFSAGSQPKGAVHPGALRLLERLGHDTTGLRSKSWDEFAGADAPTFDFVITVCGNAANETCPVWPGHPMTAHWGIADPAAVAGDDTRIDAAFALAHDRLTARIERFLALPFATLEAAALRDAVRAIGTIDDGGGADT